MVFREDQAGFLAGVLAGLLTESQTVGIVAGMEIPPVKKFRNGYENGVAYVCPECDTIGVYIDSFTDPARGKTAALSQIAEGADVIFGAGGPTGSGGILGAAQHGVWVIGVDQDEYFTTFKAGAVEGADKITLQRHEARRQRCLRLLQERGVRHLRQWHGAVRCSQ